MELAIVAMAGAGWYGWCYWRKCIRFKQREADDAYWDRVRRECPSCGISRRRADLAGMTPDSSEAAGR